MLTFHREISACWRLLCQILAEGIGAQGLHAQSSLEKDFGHYEPLLCLLQGPRAHIHVHTTPSSPARLACQAHNSQIAVLQQA